MSISDFLATRKYGVKIKTINDDEYQVGTCRMKFNPNIYDGKFGEELNSGWVVTTPYGEFICGSKKHAMTVAINNQ